MEKKKLNKIKNILVIAFIAIYLICTYFTLRGEYLECLELGEQYVQNFWTNIKYKYSIMGISFVVISICMFITNIGIKKGLKPFFESENKTMPKLPNKSLIFVVAIIGSIIFSNNIVEKVLLCASKVSFQKTDMIFNMDISYYMFTKPLIEAIIKYIMQFVILISAYITAFYIIVFNLYFDGIDRTMLRKSKFIKSLLKNVIILAILAGILTIFSTQNIVTEKFLTLNDDTEITHSEMRADGRVKVYIETPDEKDGFHNAICYLPDYKWENINGYSDMEMSYFKKLIRENAHLIMEFSQEGGILSAANF